MPSNSTIQYISISNSRCPFYTPPIIHSYQSHAIYSHSINHSQSKILPPHHATFLLPLSFLHSKILRPVLLLILFSHPCLRFCTSLVWPFMVFRGPKRSCRPCRAGCEDTAAVETRSADSGEVAAAGDGTVGEGVKELLGRKVEFRVGRRGERHVYVLARKKDC